VTIATSLVEFRNNSRDFLSSLLVGAVPRMTMHWIDYGCTFVISIRSLPLSVRVDRPYTEGSSGAEYSGA
jgi:hypothetical protein